NGGQGVAYNDTTTAHQGAPFRSDEAVDISNGTEALGYIADGEWVEYTLNVETAGTYALSFLTSAVSDGKSITAAFEQGGSFQGSSSVNLPNTGSFTSFQTVGPLAFDLAAGEQVLRLTFNGGQLDLQSFSFEAIDLGEENEQQPFNTNQTPWLVENDGLVLDAVNYDTGGQGIAYNDSSENQEGSNFRGDGVDIVGNGTAIGWIENNEWVEYTINVAQSGTYELAFLSALGTTGGAARSITASFAQGDSPYTTTSPVSVGFSGSWTTFVPTDSVQVNLEAGEQVLRLTFNGGSQDLASLSLVPITTTDNQTPFNDSETPWLIDDGGLFLDAINYDQGGAGIAYSDSSEAQLGDASIRGEGVDIVGGGEAIGWIANNEWVEYTVDVVEAGEHTFSFITATPWSGRSITVAAEKDGVFYAQASPLSVPNSGDWGNYVQGPEVTLNLQEGEQVVRLTFNGGSMDLQSLIIEQEDSQPAALNVDAGDDALGVMGVQEPSTSEQLF
ncbi:MAG: carbohydrate-binding protein, partial [Gammaproteobacteria bacterium]|nr:carbohydrate-binding protein [Gammaproteobacteria bacterium]